MEKLVSIIVPIYNSQVTLPRLFQSIVEQQYQKIEVILVNDGSTDDSLALCQEFAQKDSRIRIIDNLNRGVSQSRNDGLSVAQGEYVTFIDADDWFDTTYISGMVKAANRSGAAIVVTNCVVHYTKHAVANNFLEGESRVLVGKQKNGLLYQLVGKKIAGYYPPIVAVGVPWGKLYRRQFLVKNALSFSRDMKRMEDNIFNLYAFELANKIYYHAKREYHYDCTNASASSSYSRDILAQFSLYFTRTKEFLRKYHKEEKMLKALEMKELTSFNTFLGQYFFNVNYPGTKYQARQELKQVLRLEPYCTALKNIDYSYLKNSEKIFVFLLKYRQFWILKNLVAYRNQRRS